MKELISITGLASVSPLGSDPDQIWEHYLKHEHAISAQDVNGIAAPVAHLAHDVAAKINGLRSENLQYRDLDNSVLYGMYVAREAMKKAGWEGSDNFGVNIGSSRGATKLFEKYYQEFLEQGKTSTLSSPTTTLGNISSWIAHDLQTQGPEISHSITCSTALHALLNGVAWLQSGMTDQFIVGGSEAPLTPFTIAQMKALKIYAKDATEPYPCKALDLSKTRNTMFLGEGAAMVCLEKGKKENALAIIRGVGYATEPLLHNISISANADCFQKSMKMALGKIPSSTVDAIVMHAPGTIKGDMSEFNAITAVFGKNHPALTTNKWKIGHTFGASGMLSLELAVLMLQNDKFISVPYITHERLPEQLKRIMVNAVGFGGNAVSVLLEKHV